MKIELQSNAAPAPREEVAKKGAYLAQLLLEDEVAPGDLDPELLHASLRRTLGNVLSLQTDSRTFGFVHPDHLSPSGSGPVPAVSFVTPVTTWAHSRAPAVQAALDQTWDWLDADRVVRGCSSMVLVSDMLATGLDRNVRLDLFHAVVSAVLEQIPVAAIHWIASQRIVRPRTYAARLTQGRKLLAGPVNVRLFDVDEGIEGERIMDTRGMEAFGLPDLQCHFVGIEPRQVSEILFRHAERLFELGDVPEAWESFGGRPEELSEWRFRPGRSLVAPARRVVELQPE